MPTGRQVTPREIYLMHEAFYADKDSEDPPLELAEWLDEIQDGKRLREWLAEEACLAGRQAPE